MDSRDIWEILGESDPLWTILTSPDRRGIGWKVEEFFATGRREIDAVMEYVALLGIAVRRGRALDFGCGVGRLTQALSLHFEEVYGVDIASSMIDLAARYNRCGDRCKYFQNDAGDLKLFPDNSFDFIYSNITLQHISPRCCQNYIGDFLRLLRPRGVLLFQLTDRPAVISSSGRINPKGLLLRIVPKSLLYFAHRNVLGSYKRPKIEMYCVRRRSVLKLLRDSGGRIVDVVQNHSAGNNWVSFRYCVIKE